MIKKRATSGSPFESEIGFSRAARNGNFIAVSGTAPIGKEGKTMYPGDMYQQTIACLEIIQKAIEQLDGKLEDTIRTKVFLTDISRWEEAAKAHGDFFKDIKPASTFAEVSKLINDEWLVEIEADCICDSAG